MFRKFQLILVITIMLGCTARARSGENAHNADVQEVLNKTWQWVSTVTPVETVKVSDPERYTMQLISDGKARIRLDCNRGGADYTISQGKLAFGPLFSTRMACPEGSQDILFMRDMQRVSSFFIEAGDLYLKLPADSGTMRFQNAESSEKNATDPLDAVYTIEDQRIPLHQGKADQPGAPGSTSMIEVRVFGTPQYGDLNGDGLKDAVMFLQYNPGGSGTFFYVAAALHDTGGWQGTRAILLGDRIIPRSIEINSGAITVRYLERRPEEPMSAAATVGMSRTLILKNRQLMNYYR